MFTLLLSLALINPAAADVAYDDTEAPEEDTDADAEDDKGCAVVTGASSLAALLALGVAARRREP